MNPQTLKVERRDGVCRIAFDRPEADNAIDRRTVDELAAVLERCSPEPAPGEAPTSVVVLEGNAKAFCAGGDFRAVAEAGSAGEPDALYDIWLRMSQGPCVTVSLVRGRANAGGVGFAAAADIVIAGPDATFSLSELLFGLYPACVLPFLIRRIGRQRAHYMTLMTKPVGAVQAQDWGLVDVLADDPEAELARHLARLRLLKGSAIARYKRYAAGLAGEPSVDRDAALAANRAIFSDPDVVAGIRRYVTEMKFPWEA